MTTPAATGSLASQAAEAFRDYLDGDAGRMADLVTLLTPCLWAVARSSGLDHSRAEDVVQHGWVSLAANAASVRDPQAVFAWLLTTVRREAWRAAGRPRTEPIEVEPASEAPGPEAVLETNDRAAILWGHVTSLSPRCQALLRVVAFAAVPDYSSISAALGMPVGSIGPTRGRCLAALRGALLTDPAWSDR